MDIKDREFKDRELKDALLAIIFNSLLEIDDIDDICNYEFNIKLFGNFKFKGSVTVEFEEVE